MPTARSTQATSTRAGFGLMRQLNRTLPLKDGEPNRHETAENALTEIQHAEKPDPLLR